MILESVDEVRAQGLPRQGKVADFADMPLFA